MNHSNESGRCHHGHRERSHHSGGCCCHSGHGGMTHHQGDCGCHYGHGNRHFYSQEEIINHLEEYLEQLKAEAKGVEEHIEKLKSGK